MSETTNVRTEWGVRLTWPDGHREVRTRGRINDQPYQRRDAEQVAAIAAMDREDGRTEAIAEVVTRVIPEWSTLSQRARADVSPSGTVMVETTTEDGHPFFVKATDVDAGTRC